MMTVHSIYSSAVTSTGRLPLPLHIDSKYVVYVTFIKLCQMTIVASFFSQAELISCTPTRLGI